MFKNLSDFRYIRSRTEAFGFYLAYAALGFLIIAVTGGILGATGLLGETAEEAYQNGKVVGWVLGPLYCAVMAYVIVWHKGATRTAGVMAVLLAALLGSLSAFIGMIVSAYLTTTAYNNRR